MNEDLDDFKDRAFEMNKKMSDMYVGALRAKDLRWEEEVSRLKALIVLQGAQKKAD